MPPGLDTLPPEILFNIFSYADAFDARLLPQHPLLAVSATCHHLCDTIEEYCRGLLKKYANVSLPKTPKRAAAFVCRKRWMKYVSQTCHFCGRKTKRSAILDKSMPCCRTCDRNEIPKMTMTQAINDHHLSKLDLFTPNLLHPFLPPLSTGGYSVMGGDAMMISTPDVLARKAHIASCLGAKYADDASMRRRLRDHAGLMHRAGLKFITFPSDGPIRGEWFPTWAVNEELTQLHRDHAEVVEVLERQWMEMGMQIDIWTLPRWALEQLFKRRKCGKEGCPCERLEARRKERDQNGEERTESTEIVIE